MNRSFLLVFGAGLALAASLGGKGMAQEASGDEERETGWFDSAELSIVATEGNSDIRTLGVKNMLRRVWETATFQLRFDGVESDSAGDRFARVDPDRIENGLPPAGQTPPFAIVEPPREPDVEKYLIEARYEREITARFLWNVGASWDRSLDAGILNRYQLFGGVGNVWYDTEGLRFRTNYGLSYTDREEETDDPAKEDQFLGGRFSWTYANRLTESARYGNELIFNMSVEEPSDFRFDMINSLSVAINSRVALKVSLQWLFENQPAIEEVDLVAFTDGTGSFFESCAAAPAGVACSQRVVGTVQVRKEDLDTVFSTALVITF